MSHQVGRAQSLWLVPLTVSLLLMLVVSIQTDCETAATIINNGRFTLHKSFIHEHEYPSQLFESHRLTRDVSGTMSTQRLETSSTILSSGFVLPQDIELRLYLAHRPGSIDKLKV
jgi:hypothetical protein